MSIIQSIILGVVQGLTEFLPVSSSAHLNLFPWVFNWEQMPDSFDVALHIGTLLAIVIFFFKDWINLFVGGYKQVVKKEKSTDGKVFWYLVIAITLIVMGIILYIVDKKAKSNISYEKMTLKQSVLIGASQALAAAFPGVSRSGITMTVARALGIDRESAAKYSFLLATPITFAAVIFDLDKFVFNVSLFIGIISSFIVGILIIKFLLDYLKKGSFKIFAIYRVIIGLIVIALYFTRI